MTNQEFLESITQEGEEWRDVIGYEGLYAVSSHGRVVKYEHSQTWNNHGTMSTRVYPARLVIQTKFFPIRNKNDYGYYLTIIIGPKKNRKRYWVHQLVARHFLPNPHNYPQIDHIDSDKSNNNVCNLRWCSPKMNMNNPTTKERISCGNKGIPKTTLSIPVVSLKKGEVLKIYPSMFATKRDNFSPMSVRRCCLRELSQHKGVEWMFLSDYEASNQ